MGNQVFDVNPLPAGRACLLALTIGILIPALSAIIPIRRALSKNLNESITDQRSKTSGLAVKLTVTDSNKKIILLLVTTGSIASVGGSTMYYFMPKALLTLDYTLLLNLFFIILTGFILGLTLLANNLEGIFEMVISRVCFFWDREVIRLLLSKNLYKHRPRNKLTSIVYALTLGCVIFLFVAVKLQV